MDETLIKNLIDRYRNLLPEDPLYDDNLEQVETALEVVLPQDLPTPLYWIAYPSPECFHNGDPSPAEVVQPFEDFTAYFAFMVEDEENERLYEADARSDL